MNAILLLLFALTAGQPPASGVKPAFPFTSNAVLQRDKPIPVWGTAETDGFVKVMLGGHSVDATVVDGKWSAELPAMEAGGPHLLTLGFDSLIVLHNILIGDVWIAGGQSNMEWRMHSTLNKDEDLPLARNPNIRYMHIPVKISETPLTDTESTGWTTLKEDTAPHMSAVAYYFASMLQDSLDIPIGIIQSFRGATRVEPWTPDFALRTDPDYEIFQSRRERPTDPPSLLYNAMIHPITPIPSQGVIWYQGEGNAIYAKQYQRTFPLLITSWREVWKDPDLDFLFVQLANFKAKQVNPSEAHSWPELREAQSMALRLPKTGMAVTLDVGEADDIHPRDKKSVGHRLARIALKQTYGRELVHSGPVYDGIGFNGNEALILFSETGSGLVMRDDFPNGFAIAGSDSVFHWAEARITGNTVILTSPNVPMPVAVRYAWADNPIISLYNAEGLPASSFRTDTWPGVTEGN